MDLDHYVFDTRWRLRADIDEVFAVLSDIASYPQWWPQVRQVQRIDESAARVVVRSFLPYSLSFTLRQTQLDPEAGVIEASMYGDLEGVSRWTLAPAGRDTVSADFHEDVVARKNLLRLFAPIARPLFRTNHTAMMRDGQRGLTAYLAARHDGPPTPRAVTDPAA